MYIHAGFNAQRHLHVLFVGDDDVHQLDQFRHHLDGRLAPLPQVLAIVQVAGDRQAARARLLQRIRATSSAAEALIAGVMPVM